MNISKFLSERTTQLPDSSFVKILRLAEEDKGVVSLGPGEPDFGTPKAIIEKGKEFLDKGFTHYSPAGGRKELKEAIAEKVKKENRICLAEPLNQVIVLSGSTEGILLSLMALLDPGEEVLVPNPGFLAYTPAVDLMNGFALEMELKEENAFQPDAEQLKKKISKRTRAMIINSPNNPTGSVWKKKVLEELADLAVEHDLLIVSDEAYEYLVYGDAKHYSIGSFNGMQEQVLTLQSFSKSFAMPGFRLGYAVGPKPLIERMSRIHIYSSICAPTISQKMGEAALKGGRKEVERMRKEFNRRRNLLVKRLKEIPALTLRHEPMGAFYVFPAIPEGKGAVKFSEMLLSKAKVLVVPGTEFGTLGEGFIRLSYGTKYELIEEALDRMEKALSKG